MNIELISEEKIIDNEEVTSWKLDKGNGAVITDLDKLLDIDIIECTWLGNEKQYIEVMHSEWNSMEHFAVVTNDGRLVKKGMAEISKFIEKEQLFLVMFSGFGLGEEESAYYNLAHNDSKMAVINRYGDYILTPEYNSIQHFYDEEVLYADGGIYDFKGKFIKKEE